MSTAQIAENADVAPSRGWHGREKVALASGVVLGLAIALIVTQIVISRVSGGTASVVIGTLDGRPLVGLAIVVALGAFAVGLCAVRVPRDWLLLVVPARFVAIVVAGMAGFAWWTFVADATVVPLVAGGCDTGYIVREDSWGNGHVYRQDGLLFTNVKDASGDVGEQPFANGHYAVTEAGDSLRVSYRWDAFTLPKLDRTPSCDSSRSTRTPTPPAPPVPPAPTFDADGARAGLQRMVAVSLDAATGPVRDSAGELLDPAELPVTSDVCGVNGSVSELDFAFSTADNAASLEQILHAWDTEGYLPDRAIQEDLRYSDTLPVNRMSIRDTTTIDGLIHMRLTSQCVED